MQCRICSSNTVANRSTGLPTHPLARLRAGAAYLAVIAAAMISRIAHFAVGAAMSLIPVRSWWSNGRETTLFGTVEGVVTFYIGIGLRHVGA